MRLLSVDFQHDFVSPGGVHYRGQPCVEFVLSTVVPFARENGIGIAVRLPRSRRRRRPHLRARSVGL